MGVHRLESLGHHQKKWWAVPTLQGKQDAAGFNFPASSPRLDGRRLFLLINSFAFALRDPILSGGGKVVIISG